MVARLTMRLVSRAALAAALLLTLLLGVFPALKGESSVRMTARESVFFAGMNDARAQHGLKPLHLDLRLMQSARSHSVEMVQTKTFAHGKFWQRIEHYGVTSGTLGETLGWAAPLPGSEDRVVQMWLASPTHRAILLGRIYHDVGIGISIGPFEGRPHALVVTADYHGPAR
jgi:uncharacterized protein YkwD